MPDERYSRQILLREIGTEGQKKLRQNNVAIVGVGALGTVAAELLVRAGVEKIILIDRDVVERSNLQRQLLFTEEDVGRSKAVVAKEKLHKINSNAAIHAEAIHLNSENVQLLQNADLILDCTDNIQTRLLVNDYCKKNKKRWIYAAAIKTSGYVMPILPEGPCLQCFMHESGVDTCDTVGVLNTITSSIAGMQVTLALKMMVEEKVEPSLFYYDIWQGTSKKITVKKNKKCKACQGNFMYLEKKENVKIIPFCSSGRYQIQGKPRNVQEMKKKWQRLGKVVDDGATLQFKDILLFRDGRALIKAKSEHEALATYSKFVGN